MNQNKVKIIVGMSGGVDSAVALFLLKKQGYDPIGVSLKYSLWGGNEEIMATKREFNRTAFEKAEKVCKQFNVPYYIVDYENEFRESVIEYFIKGLKNKITPNPCVFCNKNIKIKHLLQFADEHNIDLIATGHYARIKNKNNKYELLRGKDKTKDQSYFLCLLGQDQLKRIIFPLGNYTKKKVYQIAKKEGLDYFSVNEQSQDLCFLSQKSIPLFLEKEVGIEEGDIVDSKGNILGKHKGLHFYTFGQRRGINISNGPWWVVGYNIDKNNLIISNNSKDKALYSKEVILTNYSFVSGNIPTEPLKIKVKPRYVHPLVGAKIFPAKNGKMKLIFSQSQKLITPGQWVVFYDGKVCLGGGMIESI
ncbi:MAG: tRNA 2-thiouridine(34) synthase MnmA [bacterium]